MNKSFYLLILMFLTFVACDSVRKPRYQIKLEGTSWELDSYSVDGIESDQIESMKIVSLNEEFKRYYEIDYLDFHVKDSITYENQQTRMFPYADGGVFRYLMKLYTPTSKKDVEEQVLGAFIATTLSDNQQSFYRKFRVLDVSKSKLILEYDGNNDPFKSESETLPGAIERFEFTAID